MSKKGVIKYKPQLKAYNPNDFFIFTEVLIQQLEPDNIRHAIFILDNFKSHKPTCIEL